MTPTQVKISSKSTIARNTILLYARTLVLLFISLFTSRVVLDALGVVDFGTFTAISGVVAMINIVTMPFASSISRFITYAIGRNNPDQYKIVFSTSRAIIYIFTLVAFVILEIGGTWFLNNKMVIPADRLIAANWVLQFAIVTCLIHLITTPYSAAIIANERMSYYAYIGIIDAVLKLAIAYALYISPIDKLVEYMALLCIESVVLWAFYFIYCKYKLSQFFTLSLKASKKTFRAMFSYAGWNLFGSAATTFHVQGLTILLNMFGGPVLNAAQGIANQVNNAITAFIHNFTLALTPPIIKSYASGQRQHLTSLIYQGAKFSYYLSLFFVIPLILETDTILKIWLGQSPEYTALFIQLLIIYLAIESISKSVISSINATGIVRNYQIIVGGLLILNLPLAYIALKAGLPVESVYIISIFTAVIALYARLQIAHNLIHLSIPQFLLKVMIRITIVTIVAFAIPLTVRAMMPEGTVRFAVITATSTLSTLLCVVILGCNKAERQTIISKARSKMHI